ncbi:hypothetical protein C7I87_04190 [Mesorhizobium sp. SARCC-RB16n]|uniref:hypothetical protein n=1 Tax=Mesorhizobium sp. SARCC-RB16n TaxID=2116687 RepID=UPI00122F101B|nr:hypothetical protein [Mesorhizobium sp. SARCC-RB16n]KAA3451856.1 hypothetical protein C7I87_04190 [Mesorhizobium sp. SARCC-RB16n]
MKKLILASMLAFAATGAAIAPTQAASVTIQSDDSSDDSGIVVRRHHERRYDNQYDGDQSVQYGGYDNGGYRWRHRHHRCHIETVVHWRHHHRVVEDIRVCG